MMTEKEYQDCIRLLRQRRPLVHCITNGVSLNDCANILLAAGAKPVMAEAPEESAEITAQSDGLVLNIGMLTESKLQAMLRSAEAAKQHGLPVLLDPVGVGASAFRRQAVAEILATGAVTVIRGNLSEISALASLDADTVSATDTPVGGLQPVNVPGASTPGQAAAAAAAHYGCTAAVTGETDWVSDGKQRFPLHGGSPLLTRVTATGCMTSALIGAFLAAMPEKAALSAACGIQMMNRAGEYAAKKADCKLGSFHTALFDAISLAGIQNVEGVLLL